jgi:hypothetical protein
MSAFIAAVAVAELFGTVRSTGTRAGWPPASSARRKYARTIIVATGVGLRVGVGVGVGATVGVGVGATDGVGVGPGLSLGDGDAEAVGITGTWEPAPDGLEVAAGLPQAATRTITTSVARVR